MRWTCLSLVAIQPIFADNRVKLSLTQYWDGVVMELFAEEDDTGNNDALAGAQKMDEILIKASNCLFWLHDALRKREGLTEQVIEILRVHESEISELEQINIEADRLESVDLEISTMRSAINDYSHQIISQFPGLLDDFNLHFEAPMPFSRFVELSLDPSKLQFIRPRQTLKSMCSPVTTLRNILEGRRDADAYKELRENLRELCFRPDLQGDEMQRQLWRLQDLCDGDGLGFIVELFFLALKQLLSTSSSKESHSALYTGTFRAITSDWSKYKHSLKTQKLLLDIAVSRRYDFGGYYPAYIVDEFLLLLGNIFEGQTGPHVDEARRRLGSSEWDDSRRFRERVLRVLT